jgi:hypothetical protein
VAVPTGQMNKMSVDGPLSAPMARLFGPCQAGDKSNEVLRSDDVQQHCDGSRRQAPAAINLIRPAPGAVWTGPKGVCRALVR